MKLLRFFLISLLLITGLFLKQAWDEDYAAPLEERATEPHVNPELPVARAPVPEARPEIARGEGSREPQAQGTDLPSPPQISGLPHSDAEQGTEETGLLKVRTDVLEVVIDPLGGTLRQLDLLAYPVSVQDPETPLRLLDDHPLRLYLLQGGLLSREGGASAPHNQTRYRAEQQEYRLQEGRDTVEIRLRAEQGDLQIDKIYRFHRDRYLFDVVYEVRNLGEQPWIGHAYAQLKRGAQRVAGGLAERATFTGVALSTPQSRYEKIDFDDIEKERNQQSPRAWIAVLQHYFLSALLPETVEQEYSYYMKAVEQGHYLAGSFTPAVRISPGASGSLSHRIYVGPKIQRDLAMAAPRLDLAVDYGILWFLAKPLFWVLEWLYKFCGNWGLAIILLTVLVKALFYYPTAVSYRSMARMAELRPRLLGLRDRHREDRARLQQEMMRLYKEEKINPFGGCLPILIQLPVFIALYWVLLESVELRQAEFMLWYQDLSSADPYFVLPLLMGLTMYLQQKLNPTALDPMQERIFALLPVVFTLLLAFSPSGLVLYWVVSNILSISQQWYIRRSLRSSPPARLA